MRGFAELGRAAMITAGAPIAFKGDQLYSAMTGKMQTGLQDSLFKAIDDVANTAVDYWKVADAKKSGLGAQVIGDVGSLIPALMTGPYAVPALTAQAGTNAGIDSIKAGQDAKTAAMLVTTASISNYLGMKLPLKNPSLLKRVASAIGYNELVNEASLYASKQILESNSYFDAADNIDLADPRTIISTLLTGVIFGLRQDKGPLKTPAKPPPAPPPSGVAGPPAPPGPSGAGPQGGAGTPTTPAGPTPPASAVPQPAGSGMPFGHESNPVVMPGAAPAPAPVLTEAGPNSPVSTGAPGASATVPTPEGLKLPDVPTTESAQTLRAHFNDLRDNNTPRTAVFVTHGSIAHMSGSPDANATVVKNQMNKRTPCER